MPNPKPIPRKHLESQKSKLLAENRLGNEEYEQRRREFLEQQKEQILAKEIK